MMAGQKWCYIKRDKDGREESQREPSGGEGRLEKGREEREGREGRDRREGRERNEGREIRAVARPSKSWMMTREASRSGLRKAGGGRR